MIVKGYSVDFRDLLISQSEGGIIFFVTIPTILDKLLRDQWLAYHLANMALASSLVIRDGSARDFYFLNLWKIGPLNQGLDIRMSSVLL